MEDAPFTAVSLTRAGSCAAQRLLLSTNVGDHVTVDAAHPLWMSQGSQPRPYVSVRDGLNALIVRSVYYELVALAESNGDTAVIHSCGSAFSLGEWS